MDESREGNNKIKGAAIDRVPFRQTLFFTGLLECLLAVHLYEGITDMHLSSFF